MATNKILFQIDGDASGLIAELRKSEAAIEVNEASLGDMARAGDAVEASIEEVADAAENAADSFDKGTEAIGSQKKEIRDVKDIVESLNSPIADQVLKWGLAAGAVGVLSKALLEVSDQAEDYLKQLGASEESAALSASIIRDIAQPWKIITGNSEAYAAWLNLATGEASKLLQTTKEQANAAEVLAKFTEQHKAALAGVKAETDAIATAEKARADAMAELQKQATGFSLAGLNTEIGTVLDLFDQVGQSLDGSLGSALAERVEKAGKAFDAMGASAATVIGEERLAQFTALREQVAGVADESAKAATSSTDLAKSQDLVAAAGQKTIEVLQSEVAKLQEMRKSVTEITDSVNEGMQSIEESFNDANDAAEPEQVRNLRQEIAALEGEERNLAGAFGLSGDQLDRQIQISEELFEANRKLRDAERAAAAEFIDESDEQIERQKLFKQELAEAQEQIAGMDPAVRAGQEAIIARYRALNETVNISREDVQNFRGEFEEAMIISGQAIDGLRERTEGSLAAAKTHFELTGDASQASTVRIIEQWGKVNGVLMSTKKLLGDIAKGMTDAGDAAVEAI